MVEIVQLEDYRQQRQQEQTHLQAVRVTGLAARQRKPLSFNRDELGSILALYSQMVARGIWRDYAIDQLPGQALFSIYRNSAEAPTYVISKQAGPNGKGREFLVFQGQKRMKRGERLSEVLAALRLLVG